MTQAPTTLIRRQVDGAGHALELVGAAPNAPSDQPPLLFVHGAFGGAWCFEEHFLPWFAARGRAAWAVSLRGHGSSGGREALHAHGLDDYVNDVRAAIKALGGTVVAIGHSMGAMAVQKVIGRAPLAGVALLAPLSPAGLLPASLQLAAINPSMWWNAGMALAFGPRFTDSDQVRRALFSAALAPQRARGHLDRMQAESRRAAMDCAAPGITPSALMHRLPALTLGCAGDQLAPPAALHATALWHGSELRVLPRDGHLQMLDHYWDEAAQEVIDWLSRRGI